MADFITVGKGDTLSELAKLHGTTVEKLCELNGIKDPDKLQIGQKLSLGNTTEGQPKAQVTPEITPEQLAAATEKAKSEAAQTEQMIQEEGTFERAGKTLDEGVAWAEEKLDQAGKAIVAGYNAVEEFVTTDVPEAVETGVKIALGAGQEAIEWADEKLDQAGEAIVAGYNAAENFVTEVVPEAVETGIEITLGAGQEAIEWADEKLDQFGDWTKETYQEAKKEVKEDAQKIAQKAKDIYDGAVDLAKDIGTGVKEGAQWVADTAVEYGEGAIEAGKKAIAYVDNKVDQVGDAIDDGVRSTGRKAKDTAKGFFASLKADTPQRQDRSQALESDDTMTRLEAKGEEIKDDVKDFVRETWNDGVEAAEDIARKGYRGIKKAWNWLTGD